MTGFGGHYDAVVAGAGPAGSAAARHLAQSGARVLLLEEHREVGSPVHCSGLVTPRTLDEANVGTDLVLHKVSGARIYSPSGNELTLGDGRTRALVIDRAGLDRALANTAQRYGAHLELGAKVTAIESKGTGLRVIVKRNSGTSTVTTQLLVGADGAHSRVARLAGLDGPKERVIGLGAEGSLPNADEEHVQVFVGRSLAPGWFGWTIPLGNGHVRIGLGTSSHWKPVDGLKRLMEAFPEHFRGWVPSKWTGGTIPLWSRRQTVVDNIMLVGDAAGQVKPTSGGGIYPGLVGGRLAAQTAIQALSKSDLSRKSLASYPRAWDKALGYEFQKGADLRSVYTSLNDGDFERLVRLFGNKRLLQLINREGDIDFPGGMFQRLTKLAPILWMFVRGPLRYASQWKQ
jgi:digeranylgeranylglycerophospholipid reductase